MSKKSPLIPTMIFGSSGKMGLVLQQKITAGQTFKICAKVSSKEIQLFDDHHTSLLKRTPSSMVTALQHVSHILDFSSAKASQSLINALGQVRRKVVLMGTTGLTTQQVTAIKKIAKVQQHKILMSGNTSFGIASLAKMIATHAGALSDRGFDIEVIETHHRYKSDAPSGTALILAKLLQSTAPDMNIVFNRIGPRLPKTIGVHSVRGGGVVGEHCIRFIDDDEEISLTHRAFNRNLFAGGALDLLFQLDTHIKAGQAKNMVEYFNEDRY